MKNNVIRDKSYAFAIRIINLYKYLAYTKKEFVLSKQTLRCGTSIGANVEEAIGAQSSKDFIAKLSISYKEARETSYWIRLLRDTNFINKIQSSSMLNDCEEILKIIGKIQVTMKNRNS
ncbi:MAG: four helix bundle protein [Patescibacteria group bacterium]|nr:four helix bundle protein [Patescibacteria group bacterium]